MIKKIILALIVLSVFLGLELSSSFSRAQFGGSGQSTTKYLFFRGHDAGEKPDALREVGEVLGAELFAFKLEYSLTKEMRVIKIVFGLSDMEGISREDFSNIELVVDENVDGRAEEQEARVGGLGQIEVVDDDTFITFSESFTVPRGATNYILKADLKNLVLGDKVAVISHCRTTEAETVSGKKVSATGYVSEVIHIAGNFTPTLSWPVRDPAEGVGVHPQKGKSGDEFAFEVLYADPDNDPPSLAQIWIDENDNGSYEENEKYNLDELLPEYKTYKNGKLYQKTLNVLFVGDGEIAFKFKFSDGEFEAEGEPTKDRTISVFPLAMAIRGIKNLKFVSGQRVEFGVAIISFINVEEIEKASVKDLAKTDLTPFKIEKVILGEKEPLEDMQDIQIIWFVLSLDDNLAPGKYTIPSFEIPYSYIVSTEEEEKEIQGVVATEPIDVEKVLLLVKSEVDKKAMVIGDKIHLPFTFTGEKGLKIYLGNLLEGASEEDIQRLSVELTKKVSPEVIEKELKEKLVFGNFKLLDVRFHKQELGPIDSWVCDFTLSFYGLEGTEESGYGLGEPAQVIPPFRVLYYVAPEEIEAEKKIETQELVIRPIAIKINSVLAPDSGFENIKGALTFENLKFYWIWLVAGIALLLILAAILIVQLAKKATLKKKEGLKPWRIARTRLERLILFAPEEATKPYLEQLNSFLRRFLGTWVGVSEEEALAKTASEFRSLLRGHLEEDLIDLITDDELKKKGILQQLDRFVFGDILPKKEDMQRILEDIKRVLGETENNNLK